MILLDNRKFSEWLALFADGGYYEVLQRANFDNNDNLVIVGEDLKRLNARLVAGEKLDRRSSVHILFGAQCEPPEGNGKISACSNFAMWRDGMPSFAGRYYLKLQCDESDHQNIQMDCSARQ